MFETFCKCNKAHWMKIIECPFQGKWTSKTDDHKIHADEIWSDKILITLAFSHESHWVDQSFRKATMYAYAHVFWFLAHLPFLFKKNVISWLMALFSRSPSYYVPHHNLGSQCGQTQENNRGYFFLQTSLVIIIPAWKHFKTEPIKAWTVILLSDHNTTCPAVLRKSHRVSHTSMKAVNTGLEVQNITPTCTLTI